MAVSRRLSAMPLIFIQPFPKPDPLGTAVRRCTGN
jgi:hypothetical protein